MKLSLNIGQREFGISIGKSVSPSLANWAKGGDGGNAGGAKLTSAYQQSEWVYACISAMAAQVAQIPFRFSRVERTPMKSRAGKWRRKALGEQIVEGGPLVELFNRPHPHLNRFQFWELIITWLQLRGEFFAVPLEADLRLGPKPTQFAVLAPDMMREIVDLNALRGWNFYGSINTPAPSLSLLTTDVITDRLANPYDFWRGMSPLTVALLAAQTDYASGQFTKGLMLNNADTGVIVRTDQQLDETQREQLLAALKERKRQAGTADRPLLLWGGAEVIKPTLSSADMQLLEQRKFSRQQICAVFKTPQEIIGFTEDANKSVSQSARLNWIENQIAPLCERLEAAFDPFIKTQDRGLWGWFDIEALAIMQQARRERYTGAAQAFSIGVPIDDCSEIFDLGLPDDLPHVGKSFLPFNLQEFGATENQPTPSPSGGGEPAATENPVDAAAKILKMLTQKAADSAVLAPAHVCVSPAGYLNSIRGSVKKKTGVMRRFFFEQRGRVLSKLANSFKTLSDSRLKEFTAEHRAAWDELFNVASENATLAGKLRSLLIADLEFGGAQMFQEIGAVDFKLPPSDALAYLAKRQESLQAVNETTKADIVAEVQAGVAAGESYEQIAARVKQVYRMSDGRAAGIALTETNTAINTGKFTGMKQAKVEKKSWLASNLQGSRASHQQAAIDYKSGIGINEAFVVGGEKMMHPGDPSGSAGNVINCHCTLIAMQGDKAMTPAKFLSYEEWLHVKGVAK